MKRLIALANSKSKKNLKQHLMEIINDREESQRQFCERIKYYRKDTKWYSERISNLNKHLEAFVARRFGIPIKLEKVDLGQERRFVPLQSSKSEAAHFGALPLDGGLKEYYPPPPLSTR